MIPFYTEDYIGLKKFSSTNKVASLCGIYATIFMLRNEKDICFIKTIQNILKQDLHKQPTDKEKVIKNTQRLMVNRLRNFK